MPRGGSRRSARSPKRVLSPAKDPSETHRACAPCTFRKSRGSLLPHISRCASRNPKDRQEALLSPRRSLRRNPRDKTRETPMRRPHRRENRRSVLRERAVYAPCNNPAPKPKNNGRSSGVLSDRPARPRREAAVPRRAEFYPEDSEFRKRKDRDRTVRSVRIARRALRNARKSNNSSAPSSSAHTAAYRNKKKRRDRHFPARRNREEPPDGSFRKNHIRPPDGAR